MQIAVEVTFERPRGSTHAVFAIDLTADGEIGFREEVFPMTSRTVGDDVIWRVGPIEIDEPDDEGTLFAFRFTAPKGTKWRYSVAENGGQREVTKDGETRYRRSGYLGRFK